MKQSKNMIISDLHYGVLHSQDYLLDKPTINLSTCVVYYDIHKPGLSFWNTP